MNNLSRSLSAFFTMIIGLVLLVFGLMKRDIAAYIGGDTPLMTLLQIVGGVYLMYVGYRRRQGK